MFQKNIQHLMEQIKRALQKTSGNKSWKCHFGTTGLGIVAYNPGNNSYGQLINEIQQRKLDQ
jgi:hypothetical protein